MNGAATRRHRLEDPEGRRAMNAEGLLREAYADLVSANRRLARMRIAMRVAAKLLVKAAGDQ